MGESKSYRTWLLKNYEPVPPIKYFTDDFSDEAVTFIERNRFAVRDGNEKLIIPWKGGTPQLYDLSNDIGEQKDIAKEKPMRVQELDVLRKKWNDNLMEPTFLGLIHTAAWAKRKRK